MTEEIIIDGINVAGCRYFRMNNKMPMCRACNSGTGNPYCEYEKSCYYKQLKRLEQENKELKKTKGRCAFKSLDNTFCDEARTKIDKLELDKDCLNASLETARKYRGVAEVERDKYRSALEEIREIADKCKECLNEDDDCGCDYLRIKRRIEEVLGNENN